jgi:hypothetical protein
MSLDGLDVVWTEQPLDGGTVKSIPKSSDGGAVPTTLMSGEKGVTSFVRMNGTNIWLDVFATGDELRGGTGSGPPSDGGGGKPPLLATSPTSLSRLLSGGTDFKVYWCGGAAGILRVSPLDGDGGVPPGGFGAGCMDFALDPEHVFWTSSSGAVFVAQRDGSALTQLAKESTTALPGPIAASTTHVFWITPARALHGIGVANGAATGAVFDVVGPGGPVVNWDAVATDASWVYFASSGDPLRVYRCPQNGCAGKPELIAQLAGSLGSAAQLAADDSALYLLSNGLVWRLAR